MSIVVRDMEMPETCEECPFHVYHSHYEYVCKATPMLYPMNLANCKGIRKDWCPLSEAPELQWIPCHDPSDLPKDKRIWITRQYEVYGFRDVSNVIWDMTEWSDNVSGVVAYMPYIEPEPYEERREDEK